jgi:hypothetical protein
MSKLNMTRALGAAVIALTLAATAALAQSPPTRIRGQIEKVDGAMYSLKTRDGTMVNFKLANDVRLSSLSKITVADIKPDSFIGIAGIPKSDGSVEAFSIHVLPAAARGRGEGERPWDAKPGSTMTNAYLESTVASSNGQTLMVKYPGGEKKVIVTPTTIVAAAGPADKSELKPGAQVAILGAEKEADGSVLAKVMYVGRSVTPAM